MDARQDAFRNLLDEVMTLNVSTQTGYRKHKTGKSGSKNGRLNRAGRLPEEPLKHLSIKCYKLVQLSNQIEVTTIKVQGVWSMFYHYLALKLEQISHNLRCIMSELC